MVNIEQILLFTLLVCNAFMCGVIWFVQLVHYPMMRLFDHNTFIATQLEHQSRTSRVVMIPMLISLLASIALPILRLDALSIVNIMFTFIWCCSTAFWQIPLHNQLAKIGFNEKIHLQLVKSNWLRTITWTLQLIVNLLMVYVSGHKN
jgi:hypothetical protein